VAALAILAVATAPLTLIVGITASITVLVAVAVADTVHEDEHVPARSTYVDASAGDARGGAG
jgi:hypothetical protein